mmetsp:Transcript_2413/g.5160  ORF Transcript_2413/g.5160 Transcript_2413/m.5160 type:complete len:133 (-) Transcript_2413:137-535(-)
MNSVVIKIDPDFIEYFYRDLQPMTHYIPATLDNITSVVEYAINKSNEEEIRGIIHAANSWCQRTFIESKFVEDTMMQIEVYRNALTKTVGHGSSWTDKWKGLMARFDSSIGDLENCKLPQKKSIKQNRTVIE